MENNIINLNEVLERENKLKEINIYFNLLKYVKFSEVKSVSAENVSDIDELNFYVLGFRFDNCFVPLADDIKAFRIDTDLSTYNYFPDEEGLFVSSVYSMYDSKFMGRFKKDDLNIKQARKIFKWYHNKFINEEEIIYSNDREFR